MSRNIVMKNSNRRILKNFYRIILKNIHKEFIDDALDYQFCMQAVSIQNQEEYEDEFEVLKNIRKSTITR